MCNEFFLKKVLRNLHKLNTVNMVDMDRIENSPSCATGIISTGIKQEETAFTGSVDVTDLTNVLLQLQLSSWMVMK